jgi:hypothetical protein
MNGNPERKRPRGRHKRRWKKKNNIGMDLREKV